MSTFWLFCTLFFSLAYAIPWASVSKAATNPSTSLLSTLAYYEQYAAAAYCNSNTHSAVGTVISCSAGNCGDVQKANATTAYEFHSTGLSYTTGFVAVDHVHQLVILAFRGTDSIEDWITNIDISTVSISLCSGCQVHEGFSNAWNMVSSSVTSSVQAAHAKWPNFSIIVTGHSLGGAMATLAAANFRTTGTAVTLVTYGSPMVGNANFATFVTNQGGSSSSNNYRVTHANDPVPKLPGYLLGFRHVSPEYWITSGNGVPVIATNVQVSQGVQDLSGDANLFSNDLNAHDWYFNDISAC